MHVDTLEPSKVVMENPEPKLLKAVMALMVSRTVGCMRAFYSFSLLSGGGVGHLVVNPVKVPSPSPSPSTSTTLTPTPLLHPLPPSLLLFLPPSKSLHAAPTPTSTGTIFPPASWSSKQGASNIDPFHTDGIVRTIANVQRRNVKQA